MGSDRVTYSALGQGGEILGENGGRNGGKAEKGDSDRLHGE